MKIAVTYDGVGDVFQHFGRTEAFKIYDIRENRVYSTLILESNGVGHGALAGLLAENGVDLLICGGIGGGAQNALAQAGIEVITGAEGIADLAVEAYLRGELVSAGVTCSHHEGEEHCCGHHGESEEEECGPALTLEGRNAGKVCRVHYRGTFDDGSQFDSSYDRGEPIEFICGAGMMIKGFDAAVADMEPGEKKKVHLMPEEAYGQSDPRAFLTIPVTELPGAENLSVGQRIFLANNRGQRFPVCVAAKENGMITLDANHEMAGKELNFEIELLEVR